MPNTELTNTQKLAEMLHDRICHQDIGGACSWKYAWKCVDNPWSDPKYYEDDYWPLKRYLEKANRLLIACNGSFDKANIMIVAIFGY